MIKMQKPSGTIVEVNEKSLEYAKSLGWVEVADEQPKPKRGRKRGNSKNTN